MNGRTPGQGGCRGQSLIESCLVIALICIIFMGIFQVSQLAVARDILNHAAARGARARTVGFNRFMVEKVVRVAAIPNAGTLLEPAFENENTGLRAQVASLRPGELWEQTLASEPGSHQAALEKTRIPEYLGSENWAEAAAFLDYRDWDRIHPVQTDAVGADGQAVLQFRVWQDYRLRVPLARAFYRAETIRIEGASDLEQHHSLYLEDRGW